MVPAVTWLVDDGLTDVAPEAGCSSSDGLTDVAPEAGCSSSDGPTVTAPGSGCSDGTAGLDSGCWVLSGRLLKES